MKLSISKAKLFKAISLNLLVIIVSLAVIAAYRNVFGAIAGGAGLLLFGAMLAIQIPKLFYAEPQIIINSEGIEDKRLKTGLIEWEEINSVSLETTKNAKWLNLILISPEKYYCKLPKFELFLRKMNGQKGTNDFRIRFNELDKSVEETFDFIENILENREESLHLAP